MGLINFSRLKSLQIDSHFGMGKIGKLGTDHYFYGGEGLEIFLCKEVFNSFTSAIF